MPSEGGRSAQKHRTRPAVLRGLPARRSEHLGQTGPGAVREREDREATEQEGKEQSQEERGGEARAQGKGTQATHRDQAKHRREEERGGKEPPQRGASGRLRAGGRPATGPAEWWGPVWLQPRWLYHPWR